MIFATSHYDPGAPEEDKKSEYMSRKDLIRIFVIMAFVLAILYPVYLVVRRSSYKAICRKHVMAISGAMQQYSAVNDDRLPPVFDADLAGAPLVFDGEQPAISSWVSKTALWMSDGAEFACPGAREGDACYSINPDAGGPIPSTFGMYSLLSAVKKPFISSPSNTILLAESSNFGANDTLDPFPYKDADGEVVPLDGVSIAYDDSNYEPDPASTDFVTRLAFYNAALSGYAAEGVETRYTGGILVLYADGHAATMGAAEAYLLWTGTRLGPPWGLY